VCVTQQNLCAHTHLQKSKFSAEDSYQYLVVYEVWLSTWYAYVLGQGTFKTKMLFLFKKMADKFGILLDPLSLRSERACASVERVTAVQTRLAVSSRGTAHLQELLEQRKLYLKKSIVACAGIQRILKNKSACVCV